MPTRLDTCFELWPVNAWRSGMRGFRRAKRAKVTQVRWWTVMDGDFTGEGQLDWHWGDIA